MSRLGLPLLLAVCACDAAGDWPGVIIMPGMVFPTSYEAFDKHPSLGPVLRQPAIGTVQFGAEPFAFAPGPEEAKRAAVELHSPFAAPTPELPRGKLKFDTYCQVCHGPTGQGDGPVIGAGRFPNPPVLTAAHAKGLPDGQLFHIATFGQGLMPAHGKQLSVADRWRVVAYVRFLQREVTTAPPTAPAAAPLAPAPAGAQP